MAGPLRRRGRNGVACGTGRDEIVTSVEQQAKFAFLDRFRFRFVNFVNVRQQGYLRDDQQQADTDNAHRGQESIYLHDTRLGNVPPHGGTFPLGLKFPQNQYSKRTPNITPRPGSGA